MADTTIRKHIEVDAGHRVPDHQGKCWSPHGHRYRVEACARGPVQDRGAENGMVVDFGALKELLVELVHDRWDHAYLYSTHDAWSVDVYGPSPYKVCELPCSPTAENLARLVYDEMVERLPPPLQLVAITVWETPTCSASYPA